MKSRTITKTLLCLATLAVLLFVFILLDLSWAANRVLSIGEVWDALTGNGTWGTNIIVMLRPSTFASFSTLATSATSWATRSHSSLPRSRFSGETV